MEVFIGAEPRLERRAEALRVRIWNTDGEFVTNERKLVPGEVTLPATAVVVPVGGDASRTWFLEASLQTDDGATSVMRVRGGFEAGTQREVHRCFRYGCRSQGCGEIGEPPNDTATTATVAVAAGATRHAGPPERRSRRSPCRIPGRGPPCAPAAPEFPGIAWLAVAPRLAVPLNE